MNHKVFRHKSQAPGQGLVEFSLILPLLLLVTFGIIELGRLLFVYTSVHAASREAARYAAASGETLDGQPCYYLDNAGIIAAGERIAGLSGATVSAPTYDHGPVSGGTPLTFSPTACDEVLLGDRVNVTVTAQYNPLLGLTPLQAFAITAITSRTILKEISIYGNPAGGGGSPVLVVQITQPSPSTFYIEGETVPFNAVASGGTPTYSNWTWTSDKDGPLGPCTPSADTTSCSFSTNSLTYATHVITVKVTDSAGATAQAQIVFSMRAKPVVTINLPEDGGIYEDINPVPFAGTATDVEDGNINQLLVWRWNDENGAVIGNGPSFNMNLSVGSYKVYAEATDTSGLTGSDTATFTVRTNLPPEVTITAPADGAEYKPGDLVVFTGTAIDARDGDLSAEITWSSSINGSLGTGASVSSSSLDVGTHTITAQAIDHSSSPLTGSASIVVFVSSHDAPEVQITEPTDGPTDEAYVGQSITFAGWAKAWNSSEENAFFDDKIVWTINGENMGQAASFSHIFEVVGTYNIQATVTDDIGLTNWDTLTLKILDDQPPVVTITLPISNTFYAGDPILFAGTAVDNLDGNISSNLVWTSNIMSGTIGTGASFSTSSLIAGTHTITAKVTDSSGNEGSATKSIFVQRLDCPTPDSLIVEITGSAPIKVKYSWGMTMPGVAGGTAVLSSVKVSWFGGTLEYITWEGGPLTLYSGSTTLSPQIGNQNIPLEYNWAGKVNLVFLFSNEPQNNQPITFEAQFHGCPLFTAVYNN